MERDNRIHVEEDRLEAYAMNSLAGDEVELIEEHLLFCGACQDRLDALERFDRAMQGAAKRIREEAASAPAPAQMRLWDRLRQWLRTPGPIWAGAVAMAGIILIMSLQVGERPGPPVNVELHAVRGTSAGTAQAGHSLHLLLDNRGVPEMTDWHIEIVDEDGSGVWTGKGTWTDTAIKATVERAFRPGTYFVRLIKDGPDPVREYQLMVTKTP